MADGSVNFRPPPPREDTPLIGLTTETYKRRWYILIIFSMLAIMEGILFNTWGPISQSAKVVYNWSNTELALIINWGNITYGFFIFVASYLIDSKGLRVGVLSSALLLLTGSALRLISMEPVPATWLNNIGQFLIGFGGCVPYSGAALLSATWFPANQRTTATALASMSTYLGDSLAFLIGPLIVKQIKWSSFIPSSNDSSSNPLNVDALYNVSNFSDPYQIKRQQKELFKLYLIEFGITAGLTLLIFAYFPSKPPSAASKSSTIKRLQYKEGLITLSKSAQFWIINAAFSPNGVFLGWTTVLALILTPIGINQEQAGWIGFLMSISGVVAGVIVSRFVDKFSRQVKLVVIIMYIITALSLIWLILITIQIIPFSLVSVYISCTLIGLCLNGSFPLFLEMACEGAYPVAEGITCGYLTMVHNTNSVLFLAILMIPNIGTVWMNYVFLGFILASFPFICMYKADRKRSSHDF